MKNVGIFLFFLLFISCRTTERQTPRVPERGLIAEKAMVVSAREEASNIGVEILKQGGNAFDAMVATEMALAVTYPFAGNLGGGGFMVYRRTDGETGALDFREKAPLAASKDMYLDAHGEVIPDMSREGAMAVGIPGTVAGIFAAHERFGNLPLAQVLEPVIDLANEGFIVTEKQAQRFEDMKETFEKVNGEDILFSKGYQAGEPNMFGLIGAEANAISPQKRMLSSMTPTIVEKNDKLWMTVGTPGGSTIITSVLQTILNVAEFGMGMEEAVNAARFHHQWLPDVVMFEPDVFEADMLDHLRAKGYQINETNSRVIGKVDGILVLEDGRLEGGADRRGDDQAVGF